MARRRCTSTLMAMATFCAGASLVAMAGSPAAATAASGGGSLNTYKLSGAVNGTLSDGPGRGLPVRGDRATRGSST